MTQEIHWNRFFSLAESNAFLSNASPAGDPQYEEIKNKIIREEMTIEAAREELRSFYQKQM
ncbi:hypothetical protein [Herminiimonas contaminans]|uniref:Uncharacterized protein n=1 Tax=Herminiimonas contaminans TaxID=1111140 RepID=A0ABS0EXZ9_9BURK|nr:hypothetical protein [Herminiimonas contaminans]MBF8179712.1 hypothetical protein [Herminiimonas contaminans]